MISQQDFFPCFPRSGIQATLLVILAGALACLPTNGRAQGGVPNNPAVQETLTTTTTPEESGAVPDLGTGNFKRSPFRVSVSIREGYDDNVYTANQNPIGSFFTYGNVVLDCEVGNDRTRLDVNAYGGATYFYDRPFGQQYDVNSGLTLTASHLVTPRLSLNASVFMTYQTEPDFATGFTINRQSGNYFLTNDRFSVSYQWTPRFSTVSSYGLTAINYADSAIGAFEDRFEHTFGNEFRYLLWPTTTVVGEYRFLTIDYSAANRNSMSHFLLGGLDHTFSPHFSASFRAGTEFRQFDNLGERTSPYGEATLNYSLGKRTSVSWTNHYGLDAPDVPGAASRKTYRTGVNASYGLTTRIISSLTLYYQHDQNEGIPSPFPFFSVPPFSEDTLDIGASLRYEINRVFSITAGFNHTEVLSDISFREYARNRYYLGLAATF